MLSLVSSFAMSSRPHESVYRYHIGTKVKRWVPKQAETWGYRNNKGKYQKSYVSQALW
jgi:hypothetical protein